MEIDKIKKEQIYVAAHPSFFPKDGLKLAQTIANAHEKEVCLLGLIELEKERTLYDQTFERWEAEYTAAERRPLSHYVLGTDEDFTDFMENVEARAVVFETCDQPPYNKPLKQLKLCRELRIPYYFIKTGQPISFERVLVPIGFLVEEREKGVFCSGMGRFFHSEIMLMTANDYGSRAKQNTEAIQSVLDKVSIPYQQIPAKKDSFKIEIEATGKIDETQATLLLITASRDYGMDDILFGPKELKVLKKATVPVMIINPRKDLYTLCG